MQNFLGDFECSLDAKGRLMIPARFRHLVPEASAGMYVISMGKERCLNLYPIEEWNEVVVSKLHELSPGREKRNYIRFYSKKSRTVLLDKSGRIAIPSAMLEVLGNPKKVMVVGVLNYMEIWSVEDYEKVSREAEDTFLEGDWEY
jgi:MraZ protein